MPGRGGVSAYSFVIRALVVRQNIHLYKDALESQAALLGSDYNANEAVRRRPLASERDTVH